MGIYIHIPFCRKACHYCNFHFSTNISYIDRMVDAICREIELTTDFLTDKDLNSIYFGGGTPSVLTSDQLERIFIVLKQYYNWNEQCEITLEANPDDMNIDKMQSWLSLGINRLSVGIQSFDDEDLNFMNRSHNAAEAISCLQLARGVGFRQFSLDLIYGSPTTDMNKWQQNIEIALSLHPEHISAYSLTVEEKTALHHQVKTGKAQAPDDSLSSEQFAVLISRLNQEGYIHYEISNFAKEGHFAKHNSSYWKNKPYLGIGPSAHSYTCHLRRWNIANNQKYMSSIESGVIPSESEFLSIEDRYNEMVMTGLRTMWGVDIKSIRDLGPQFETHFKRVIDSGIVENMIICDEGVFTLSEQGKHFADRVAMEFFWEE